MKKLLLFAVILSVYFSAPIFAANLTVNGTNMATSYINTGDKFSMLNLSLNVTPVADKLHVTIMAINITITNSTQNFSIGNISAVELINSTGHVIASNNTNSTQNNFTINFPGTGLIINSSSNYTIIVSINVSSAASRFNVTGVNLSGTPIILASNDNLSVQQVQSTLAEIRSLHANASISPRYVDTGAFNQTFQYTIVKTGQEALQNFTITIPSAFSNTTIINIMKDGNLLGVSDFSSSNTATRMEINLTSQATSNVTINFTANTSSSAVSNMSFNATLRTFLINASATDTNIGVETKPLIIVHQVTAKKLTALANGTDYWEFNFTFNFTANVSGNLLFKMDTWTNNASQTIYLNTSTTNLALLSLDSNNSRIFNISTAYNVSRFIPTILNSNSQQGFGLKMIIPSETPISSTWWTKYFMLFMANP